MFCHGTGKFAAEFIARNVFCASFCAYSPADIDKSQTSLGRSTAASNSEFKTTTSATDLQSSAHLIDEFSGCMSLVLNDSVLRHLCIYPSFQVHFLSRPNKVGLKCPTVRPFLRPSVHKKFLQFQWNLACR